MESTDVIISLIKEVVKKEVKSQVKEEIIKLVKAGVLAVPQKPTSKPSSTPVSKPTLKEALAQTEPKRPAKSYSKNPIINEILNNTRPFTKSERAEASMAGGGTASILDAVKSAELTPGTDDEWGSVHMTSDELITDMGPSAQPDTGNEQLDPVVKALKRDYRELVKRF